MFRVADKTKAQHNTKENYNMNNGNFASQQNMYDNAYNPNINYSFTSQNYVGENSCMNQGNVYQQPINQGYMPPNNGYPQGDQINMQNNNGYMNYSSQPNVVNNNQANIDMYNMGNYDNFNYNNQYNQNVGKPAKKEKLNTKAKLLIAVYFFIIAVVATLLFINLAIAQNTQTSASANDPVKPYNTEAVSNATGEDGQIVDMGSLPPIVNYEYEVEQSWFEKMCDKIGKIVG